MHQGARTALVIYTTRTEFVTLLFIFMAVLDLLPLLSSDLLVTEH